MIATILPSSSNFHAVYYNESKVSKGSAFLLEIKNMGAADIIGYNNPDQLVSYLTEYSETNDRIKKPQFHVAISCKGNEMNYDQLLDFAHEYLKEMGYGEDGQPLLVYAHSDTENNHIHLITSRIDPNGNKIDHNHERVKSQKVLDKLLNEKRDEKVKKHIEETYDFNFRSVTQFRAVLESMGYECYEKDWSLNVKKGGMVLASVDIDEIESKIEENERKYIEPNHKQIFGFLLKYRDLNNDIDGLKKDIRKKFGMDLVFFGRKDSPYGFVIVDYNNKRVIEGSKVMNVKRLFQFEKTEDRLNDINSFIFKSMDDNPQITTKELNQKLKRMHAKISKNCIFYGKKKFDISNSLSERLEINNKLSWINSFQPRTMNEFNALARNVDLDLSQMNPNINLNKEQYDIKILNEINQIISSSQNLSDIKKNLGENNYVLLYDNGNYFAYNSKEKIIVDLDKAGIKINDHTNKVNQETKQQKDISFNNILGRNEQSSGGNREWEVGSKTKWDEIDDGRQLKI